MTKHKIVSDFDYEGCPICSEEPYNCYCTQEELDEWEEIADYEAGNDKSEDNFKF